MFKYAYFTQNQKNGIKLYIYQKQLYLGLLIGCIIMKHGELQENG